jgi:hypothetical protein
MTSVSMVLFDREVDCLSAMPDGLMRVKTAFNRLIEKPLFAGGEKVSLHPTECNARPDNVAKPAPCLRLGPINGGSGISARRKTACFSNGDPAQPDLTLDEVVFAMRKHGIVGSAVRSGACLRGSKKPVRAEQGRLDVVPEISAAFRDFAQKTSRRRKEKASPARVNHPR